MNPKDLVLYEEREGLATLTLNRPDKLNALSLELFHELAALVDAIAARPDEVGLVILQGHGRAFSAGNDLGALATHEPDAGTTTSFQAKTISQLAALPQPVIAAVRGYCLTGGLELALGADIIVAAESARFGDTHARWGLSPKWGLSQRLPRRVGASRALELMASSRMVEGPEAVSIGLAEHCWTDEDFADRLAELTETMLAGSWHSLRGAKRLLRETRDLPLDAGLAHEIAQSPGRSHDSAERIATFRR